MNKSNKRLCLISAISFIAGMVVGPLAMIVFFELISPNRYLKKQEAQSFFYRTMNALFKDTYNPEEGAVTPEFLDTYKKYEPQLGKKCYLHIIDSTPGYYECFAFFSSGDVFNLLIARRKAGF